VIFVLNPPQLLAQARDATRRSDLSTLNGDLALYTNDQEGANSFSLGSSSVTYISVPDPTATSTAGTDCTGLGFPSGGAFHCAASSTLRNVNGQGWIPVNFTNMSTRAPLSQLPVDPVNTTSTNFYYTYQTDGATYKLRAVPESNSYLAQAGANPNLFTFGSNLSLGGGPYWILVPGNSAFGTNNFYAMKYDASCASLSTGLALTAPTDGNGYQDNNSGASNCNPANNLAPSSLPGAIPIVDVSQTSAATYCANIGAHLITNNEWQTIAWNAEGQASNWSGGSVGSGYIYSGHNDDAPATALVADPNDANGYAGETNATGTQKRTLVLSNGAIVWDIGGNIWDWTKDTITGTNEPYSTAGGFQWSQFAAITNWGTMTQQTAGPSNATWSTTQGIGAIYSEGRADAVIYGFRRGGEWNGAFNAGVESFSLTDTQGFTDSKGGIRCSR